MVKANAESGTTRRLDFPRSALCQSRISACRRHRSPATTTESIPLRDPALGKVAASITPDLAAEGTIDGLRNLHVARFLGWRAGAASGMLYVLDHPESTTQKEANDQPRRPPQCGLLCLDLVPFIIHNATQVHLRYFALCRRTRVVPHRRWTVQWKARAARESQTVNRAHSGSADADRCQTLRVLTDPVQQERAIAACSIRVSFRAFLRI